MRRVLGLLALVCSAVAEAQDQAAYGASAVTRSTRRSGSTEVEAHSVDTTAAALGEPARMLLDAPGVSRAGFAGGELSVWGATGNETRVYLDGVQIPRLFHASGLRTTIHPALIRRVTLTPGAPDAAYGRGTGGVVELSTPRRVPRGYHGALRADGIDTSLTLSAANDRVELLVAGRQGYLDQLARQIFPDAEQVLPLPSHTDGAARLGVRLDAETTLTATWTYARERVKIEREDVQSRRTRGSFHVASVALERRYADGARARIVPFVSISEDDERERFAGTPLRRAQEARALGVRAEYVRPDPRLALRLGLDARGERTHTDRAGTLTLPAREGDIRLFGQAPVEAVAADGYLTWVSNVAPHASLVGRVRNVEIAPSLRLESYITSASRERPGVPGVPAVGRDRMRLLPEPRLRVTYRPSDWATLESRAALLHQPPDAQDLSAVLGNPALPPSRAVHVTGGSTFTLPWALELELVSFYRRLDALAVRNDAPQPELARALLARGRGESVGGSLSVKREARDGVFGNAAYTLSHSVRSDPDGRMRPFDRDQTHVLSALLGYAQTRWLVSLRTRAATGVPRTSVIGTYLDDTSGGVQPSFARHNRARVPAFYQLDLHGEVRFRLRDVLLAIWLDVWNVTNHVNIEEVVYTPDLSARRDLRGLPLLALAGLRLEI